MLLLPLYFTDVPDKEAKQILEHLQQLQAIIDVLAWVASRFDKAVDAIEKWQAVDDVLREMSSSLVDYFEQTDRLLLLILDKLPDDETSTRVKQETSELRRQTIKSRIHSLQVQLKKHQDNLNWLEEKAAEYGTSVTLEITNGITYEQEKIKEIEQEISYLKQQLG